MALSLAMPKRFQWQRYLTMFHQLSLKDSKIKTFLMKMKENDFCLLGSLVGDHEKVTGGFPLSA